MMKQAYDYVPELMHERLWHDFYVSSPDQYYDKVYDLIREFDQWVLEEVNAGYWVVE